MPHLDKSDAFTLIARRHDEWLENQRHWRFLADSLEGGLRYMHADYTIDPTVRIGDRSGYAPWYNYGYDPQTSQPYPISYRQICDRNLTPHLREMGTEGRDLYVMRLARTPVPALVSRTAEAHLAKIYSKEVTRKGPPDLEEWWTDVDGAGGNIDQWMSETVAPLLLALGQLDVWFDHPKAPDDAVIQTRADLLSLGLTDCVASVVLPENLLWWRLDSRKSAYLECLVFDRRCDSTVFWHVTTTDSNAYTPEGEWLAQLSRPHTFGRVPIVRVFDRKKTRCENVGQSRYESIAAGQKAIYNGESERTLADILSSHSQLMAPEDFLQAENEVPFGPDRILPMKRITGADGHTSGYQACEYLSPPSGAQETLRTHIQDLRDQADRDATLAKPAGLVAGTTVAQSGVSKSMDQADGNAILSKIAEVLANAERRFAELALTVLSDGTPKPAALDQIIVTYPKQFELFSAADLSAAIDNIQRASQAAGLLPETEGELIKRMIAVSLPGIDDDRLAELHDEVDTMLADSAEARAAAAEAAAQPAEEPTDDTALAASNLGTGTGNGDLTPTGSPVLLSQTPS